MEVTNKFKERKCEEQAVPIQKLSKNKECCEQAKARTNVNDNDPRIEMSAIINVLATFMVVGQLVIEVVGLDLIVFGQVTQKEDRDGNEGKRVGFSMERFAGDWAELLANE